MEITGTIVAIYPVQQKTEKLRTRQFVLELTFSYQDIVYTDYAVMEAKNGACDYLDENPNTESARYVVGDMVKVSFGIKGYQAKSSGVFYNVLQAWKIVDAPMAYQPYNSTQGQTAPAAPVASAPPAQAAPPPPTVSNTYAGYQQPVGAAPEEYPDDLPF